MITPKDGALGCFIGLAVGDAVGTTVEFLARDSFPPMTDMVGGGPFKLKPGQWTDDTSMAICLAESLLVDPYLDQDDLLRRFVRWWRKGMNSSTGHCFDIGNTTASALRRFERGKTSAALHGEAGQGEGNGGIMRLAPAAIVWNLDAKMAVKVSREQSDATHDGRLAGQCAMLLGRLLSDTIAGRQFRCPPWVRDARLLEMFRGRREPLARDEVKSGGYVVDTLEAALWCVQGTKTFEEAILLAVNLGDDADSVGAITGQIAGAKYGLGGIPKKWVDRLWDRDRLLALGSELFELSSHLGENSKNSPLTHARQPAQ
ncbi:ADP-ribosylglycohydrolase family protein [Roseococcus pinisoli]|uniref:ADP-ribosylglycohydrolase family protein n=1 Tax=Roseococcus pinisoli TaxID=2835040 RepID=A0ABS5QFC8_9PROT|nr:ADP-ribosylglycohydrolase family protein [Roseococcus pinisoli]MBS7812395.1 ADP-ribosylglycohydrolase family protein [Roseococcus pinisoli]